MEIALKELTAMLGGQLVGDETVKVNNISKIEEGTEGTISFLSNPKYEPHLYTTQASAVIVKDDFNPKKDYTTNLIKVKDPYSAFTLLLEQYQQFIKMMKVGREEPVFIGTDAEIGEGEYLGAFAYIGKKAKIGNNVKIHSHVSVGENVTIGSNTTIYAGVKIYDGCIIGDNCTIHANAVIGSDGFGFAPQPDGSYKDIPQVGNVIIENNVSIGAGTTIDCATMGSTIIREGVKLDNLIQVAHNVEIGKHTVTAALAAFAGSTKIGEYCMIGGQTGFAGHQKIGDKTKIGAQSGIMGDIEGGQTLIGSPAINHRDYLKCTILFQKLPELNKRIKELEKKC